MRILGSALGLALVGTACASPPRAGSDDPAGVTGCYQFRWDAVARELRLPWGFELLDRPLEGWANVPGGKAAFTRVTEGTTSDHPFAFWTNAPGDSVRVGHPGGGGYALSLVVEGRDLVGSVRPTGDFVVPGAPRDRAGPRPVVARRVLCSPAGDR